MAPRTALLSIVALGLTACAWSFTQYKAYGGLDLPPADLAFVRTPPSNWDFESVEAVRHGDVTDYDVYQVFPAGAPELEIALKPGTYEISLTGRCSSQWDYSHHKVSATLQSGHTYQVKKGCCSLLGWKKDLCLWLEDVATGDDVSRSSKTRVR